MLPISGFRLDQSLAALRRCSRSYSSSVFAGCAAALTTAYPTIGRLEPPTSVSTASIKVIDRSCP
jgi:hypothetical protein